MKFFIKTFGCIQNTSDSERIKAHYWENGWQEVKNWKEADEVIQFIKQKTAEIVGEEKQKIKDEDLKKKIERRLAKKLYKVIRREPIIVPVFMEM